MKIKIISDLKYFKTLEEEWNSLYKNHANSFFQSFSFNYYSWVDILSTKNSNILSIVLVRDDRCLKAIFPFYISSGFVRFICDIHADFCDIILDSAYQVDFNQVVQVLKNQKSIKGFRLINLCQDAAFQANTQDYKYSYSNIITKYSYINLVKGDFPSNTNMLSKQRYNINKILQRDIGKHNLLSIEDLDPFPYKDIINLRDIMIKSGLRDKNFLNKKWLFFLQDLYSRGLLQISLIKNNDKVDAISFIMRSNNMRMFWIDLFSNVPRANIYNYVSYMSLISKSFDNIEMHFGRGVYPYKIRNFRPIVKELTEVSIYFNPIIYYLFLIKKLITIMITYRYKNK